MSNPAGNQKAKYCQQCGKCSRKLGFNADNKFSCQRLKLLSRIQPTESTAQA